jgi:hypothetical protein
LFILAHQEVVEVGFEQIIKITKMFRFI